MAEITDVELKAAFYMKPEEIIDFFKQKGLQTSFDWHEVYADAHAKAFTVAKMTELDLLSDTKKLLEKSLEDGLSYGQFKKEAMELFTRKGWTGFKETEDPKTGEKRTVELGTPRRVKTIFDNNMNSAYSIGRYREQLEEIDVAPYWQYMSINDERTRPEHSAMHGKVYKADDPFWSIFYPPNGWGCRCFVRNLTRRQVEKQGLTVEQTDGNFKTITKKVGDETKEIPVYKFNDGGIEKILKPDSGWETNLGTKAWGIDIQAWNKVKNMPERIKFDFISKMAENPHRKDVIANIINETLKRENFGSRGKEAVINWFSPKILKELYKNKIELQSPIIVFEDRQVKHSLSERKVLRQKLSEKQFKNIYDYINNPDEMYIDLQDHAIIYVKYLPKKEIIENCDCIKIPVKINSTNRKRPVNYIGTTGRINSENLKNDKRYKKIE